MFWVNKRDITFYIAQWFNIYFRPVAVEIVISGFFDMFSKIINSYFLCIFRFLSSCAAHHYSPKGYLIVLFF